MYDWNESDSLEYKQASLKLSVNFMPDQKKVSIVYSQDKRKNVNGNATLFFFLTIARNGTLGNFRAENFSAGKPF